MSLFHFIYRKARHFILGETSVEEDIRHRIVHIDQSMKDLHANNNGMDDEAKYILLEIANHLEELRLLLGEKKDDEHEARTMKLLKYSVDKKIE